MPKSMPIRLNWTVVLLALPLFLLAQTVSEIQISARAKQVHERAIVIDSHDDTTQRLLFDPRFDLGARNRDGHVDILCPQKTPVRPGRFHLDA